MSVNITHLSLLDQRDRRLNELKKAMDRADAAEVERLTRAVTYLTSRLKTMESEGL